MSTTIDGYDKVSQAIAKGASSFWKSVFEDLSTGNESNLMKESGSFTQSDIHDFFATIGGAEMKIGLIPNVDKGTKCVFDSATVAPGQGLIDKGIERVSGSISIGIGISF